VAEVDQKADTAIKPTRLTRTTYFRTVYANTFRVRIGSDDIGITFGYQSELPGQSIIQDEAEVVLVPKVLKFLALALAHSVENLEVAIGKIDLPPDALEALKTVADQQSRDAVAAKTQMEEKK
jgi:hypothetical protein